MRYTHRVAISNRRLIAFDGRQVTFKVKDYRVEGPGRYTVNMRMAGNQDPFRSDLVRNLDGAFKSSLQIRAAALNRQSVATVLGRASST